MMHNNKGKPVYTFKGVLAVMNELQLNKQKLAFAEDHRDLFNNSEKLAQVLSLLADSDRIAFLRGQECYWQKAFCEKESPSATNENAAEEEPQQKVQRTFSNSSLFSPPPSPVSEEYGEEVVYEDPDQIEAPFVYRVKKQ